MAGGSTGSALDLVEMFNLETMTSCIVNVKLDQPRVSHTGDGALFCGGADGSSVLTNCYNIITGAITYISARSDHTSWSTGAGLYLMGGGGSSGSGIKTELITEDSTQAGFPLQNNTR